jgi:hypothetical protein
VIDAAADKQTVWLQVRDTVLKRLL